MDCIIEEAVTLDFRLMTKPFLNNIYILSASWAHGLIAQSNRASEQKSVVVGSNPTQANFLWLLLIIFQWWKPYASVQFAT